MSSIGGTTINPYVQGGSSYDDYLAAVESAKQNYGREDPRRTQFIQQTSQNPLGITGAMQQQQRLEDAMSRSGGAQAQQRQMMWDPESMMGGPKYNPLSQEEYERQTGVWKSHMDYKQFSKQAREQLGMDPGVWRAPGANPMFGHAFQEWQQFNQSQPGGPYTNPNQPTSNLFSNIQLDPVRDAEQIASMNPQPFDANRGAQTNLNTLSQVGLGALRGPTQQKIQQGIGSFSQGAGI